MTQEITEKIVVVNENGEKEEIETPLFVDTGEKRLKLAADNRWGVRPDQCHWLLLVAARCRSERAEQRILDIEKG